MAVTTSVHQNALTRCMLVGLQNESNVSLTCNLINSNLSLSVSLLQSG